MLIRDDVSKNITCDGVLSLYTPQVKVNLKRLVSMPKKSQALLKNGPLVLNYHYIRYRLQSLVLPWNLTSLFHGNQPKIFPHCCRAQCLSLILSQLPKYWLNEIFLPEGHRRVSHISVFCTKQKPQLRIDVPWEERESASHSLLTISHHHSSLADGGGCLAVINTPHCFPN